MNGKISLTGDLGSGKSTVSNLILKEWPAEYYGTGVIAREIAASMNMDIEQLNKYMETHKELDKLFDDRLVALSDDPRDLIIDSRMAWHFTKGTFRVYLTTDPTVSAARIMGAGRSSEQFASLEACANSIRSRKESEKKRYFELYGVHCKDLRNYDLVIDTTYCNPEDAARLILTSFEAWLQGDTTKRIYVCPRRLRYPDDEQDMAQVMELSDQIDLGESLAPVVCAFQNEQFFVLEGAMSALAYALSEKTFVPIVLKDQSIQETDFVQMEDSL